MENGPVNTLTGKIHHSTTQAGSMNTFSNINLQQFKHHIEEYFRGFDVVLAVIACHWCQSEFRHK